MFIQDICTWQKLWPWYAAYNSWNFGMYREKKFIRL